MNVIVAQHGARRRYLVAKLLLEHGMLEALYTDSSARSACGRIAGKMGSRAAGPFRRLAAREMEGIPTSKTFTTDRILFSDMWASKFRKETSWGAWQRRHDVLSSAMLKWGTRKADAIYAMQDESHNFLLKAKEEGVKVVVDICVTPLAHRITLDEHKDFPGWEKAMCNDELEALEAGMRANLLLADMVLCASPVVANDVSTFAGVERGRLAVVPYGSSFPIGQNDPQRGRIFYAGAACLRKGIQYLAKAAKQLEQSNPSMVNVRIAGAVSDNVRQKEECEQLEFLGKLAKQDLMKELAAADAFVLPTLAEGLPAVILEAMSFGLPIITTASSGVQIVDGESGLLIPERDAEALANAIERVVTDRSLREKLSQGARQLAHEYTLEAAGKRLVKTLQTLGGPNAAS